MNIPDEQSIITGYARLDLEHQQILSVIEQLEINQLSRTNRIELCEKLIHYVSEHIVGEENLMKLYKVPDMEKHFEDHQKIQKDFLAIIGSFIRYGGEASEQIRKSIVDHIITFDMPMIKHVKENKDNY